MTDISRERPTTSASGAMIGIITMACPEPDGMKKLIRFCTTSMPMPVSVFGREPTRFAR